MTLLSVITLNLYANDSQEKVKIWGAGESPYVRKVVSVLEYKHIPYDLVPILPAVLLKARGEVIPPDFAKASPLGKIPAMEYKGINVSDSAVITAFLEKVWPNKFSVYPTDPAEYAKALWLEKYADTTLSDTLHKIYFETYIKAKILKASPDQAVLDTNMKNVPGILSYLESCIKESSGNFLVGNRMTIADMAIVHHLYDLQLSKVKIDWTQYPMLAKYLERTLAEPSIQKALKLM